MSTSFSNHNPDWDQSYIKQAMKHEKTASNIEFKANNNMYIARYMQKAFIVGSGFGAAYGIYLALPNRNYMLIAKCTLAGGIAYSGFHGVSAFFRSEL